MKKMLIMLLMLALLTVSYAGAATLENVPEWLEGTLCINAIGTILDENGDEVNRYVFGREDWSSYDSYLRYVVFYNFDNGTIDVAEIPYGARLGMDLREGGQPVLMLQADNFWTTSDTEEQTNKREYYVATLINDPSSEWHMRFKHGIIEDYASEDAFSSGTWGYYNLRRLDGVLEPVAIQGPGFCVYYFGYGVSEDGQLELQMIREDGAGKTVLARFDMNDTLERLEYSISYDGKFAWQELMADWYEFGTGRIFVSDGEKQTVLSVEGRQFYNPCWLNATELACMEYGGKCHYLCKWNIETGEIEYLEDAQGETFCIDSPAEMSARVTEMTAADGKYIVILHDDRWWAATMDRWITIYCMENGESYTFNANLMAESNAPGSAAPHSDAYVNVYVSEWTSTPRLTWSTQFDPAEWA